jgi:subtilisin family serine protease
LRLPTLRTWRGTHQSVRRGCTAAALVVAAATGAAAQVPAIDASVQRLMQPELRARIAAHGIISPDQPPEAQPFGGAYSFDTDAAGRIRVAVFIELPATAPGAVLDALRAAGAEVGPVVGDIAVVRIPLDAIDVLGSLPAERVQAARALRTVHDSSIAATGAHLVRERGETGWTGTTGAGAIVAIIDTGLDITHPDFHDDTGATRVVGLWDQLVGARPPAGFTYGFYCTREDIQLVIDTGNLAACPTTDLAGHGTHVAGSAAGSGAAGEPAWRYAGMAPEAELLIVKAGNGTFTEDRVIDGAVWLQRQAQTIGRPVVLNLSLGHHYGPHDGSLLFERVLDALAGPGFIIVVAAGNEGANMNAPTPGPPRLIHARTNPPPGQTAAVQFQVTPYTPNANACTGNFIELSLWYDVRDRVRITVVRPDGSQHSTPSGTASHQDDPHGRIEIHNASPLPPHPGTVEGAIHISGCGDSGTPAPGAWTIMMRPEPANGAVGAPLDLYLNNVRLGPGGSAFGTTGFDNRYIVGSPGNARRVITVGAFTTRTCWPTAAGSTVCYSDPPLVGDLAPFSSGGPTRDGRIKPEIVAPGMGIVSALSAQTGAPSARRAPGGRHWTLEGTSMAAPHVAGAVALLLQHRGSLTPEDVREILLRSARQDMFTQRTYDPSPAAQPSDWWGFGKLDVPAALTELLGGGAVAAVHITPRLDTVPVGGTLQLRAIARDDTDEPVFANFAWTSLDPAVATVSPHGQVRGVAPGSARIVASAGERADTALVVVMPPAVVTMHARSAAPAEPVQVPAGTLLPLLALTLSADGPEAVEVRALAFELTGMDPAARLVLLDDPAGDGELAADSRVIASRAAALTGTPRVVVLNTDTLVVPRDTSRHLIVALELSGQAATGTVFTARLLREGTRTVAANSRAVDRFELAGALASEPAVTTVLRAGELFALSENPVRRNSVLFNFAAPPTVAAVYTATGSRVVDLLPRIDGLSHRWELTNDAGDRIVPGVYLLLLRVEGQLVRERIIVLSPRAGDG